MADRHQSKGKTEAATVVEFGSVVEVEVVAVDVNVVVTVVWVTVEFPAVLSVASVGTSVSST
jgi:hypothetical protein